MCSQFKNGTFPSYHGPTRLQVLLAGCRLDLASTRRRLARAGTDGSAASVEAAEFRQQLDQVAGRLEQATARLEAALRVVDGTPIHDGIASSADERGHGAAIPLGSIAARLAMQGIRAEAGEAWDTPREGGMAVGAVARGRAALQVTTGPGALSRPVELGAHLEGICDELQQRMSPAPGGPVLRTYLTRLEVSPDLACRLGLVVTELVSNAIYHAFPAGRPGLIWVVGYSLHDGSYVLCVEDNGVGLPSEFDLRFRPHGIGLRTVNILIDQAKLRMTCCGEKGAWFVITLPAGRTR